MHQRRSQACIPSSAIVQHHLADRAGGNERAEAVAPKRRAARSKYADVHQQQSDSRKRHDHPPGITSS